MRNSEQRSVIDEMYGQQLASTALMRAHGTNGTVGASTAGLRRALTA